MENKILELIKNKKNLKSQSKNNSEKDNSEIILQYKINIEIKEDFHFISSDEYFLFVNDQILHFYDIKNEVVESIFLNKFIGDENPTLEVIKNNFLVMKIRSTNQDYDNSSDTIEYDYIFFMIQNLNNKKESSNSLESINKIDSINKIESNNFIFKESFRLKNCKQVLLFKDYFLYVKDKVYKRKYKKVKENIILNESVNEVFVIDEIVYFRIKDKIYNTISISNNLIGNKLYNLDKNYMLLINKNIYQIIDKEKQIPKSSMTIENKIMIKDNYLIIKKESCLNLIKLENGNFKILGSVSVGLHKEIGFLKSDNVLNFFIFYDEPFLENNFNSKKIENNFNCKKMDLEFIRENSQKCINEIMSEKNESNELENVSELENVNELEKEDQTLKSLQNLKINSEINSEINESSLELKNKSNKNKVNDNFKNKSNNKVNKIENDNFIELNLKLEKLEENLSNKINLLILENKKKEQLEKKKSASLILLKEQIEKMLIEFENKISKKIIHQQDLLKNMKSCFSDILLPKVEASLSELKFQIQTAHLEETVSTLLKKQDFKKALSYALDGTDEEILLFSQQINLSNLKSFSNSNNLYFLDRLTFLYKAGNIQLIDIIKKTLSVIDVNDFVESEISVFKRIIKRLCDSDDQVLNLLLETQAHLFAKACMRNYSHRK